MIFLYIFGGVLLLIVLFVLILYFRLPHIFAKKMRSPFDNLTNAEHTPEHYERVKETVVTTKNLTYPSPYPANRFDLYLPKEGKDLPLIVWVHGGGFIAGTKDGTEHLMTMIAASGYAVISMDYAVAPEYKYPTATLQVCQMLDYLPNFKKDYPQIGEKTVLGGDSAGGHLCAQAAIICTNEAYRKEFQTETNIKLDGVILFSAPLDIATMLPKKNFKLKLLSNVFANGYFGLTRQKKRKRQACLRAHVTSDFPPAFLSDGNTMSFENQNREFAATLKNSGVATTELYWDKTAHGAVNHEYMFELNTEPAKACFEKLLEYLRKTV